MLFKKLSLNKLREELKQMENVKVILSPSRETDRKLLVVLLKEEIHRREKQIEDVLENLAKKSGSIIPLRRT